MRSGLLAAVALASLLGACDDEPDGSGTADEGSSLAEPGGPAAEGSDPARGRLLHAADRRALTEGLRAAASGEATSGRRTATLAMARLHDRAAVPLLEARLRDPDPEVRRHASLGLGALEEAAPPDVEPALLGALAAETDPATRRAMLWDLGRIGTETALDAFRQALATNQPALRATACRGLGAYGLRGRPLPAGMVRRIATRAVDDAEASVRRACAYALSRIPPPGADPDAQGPIVRDLARAAEDADPGVRAMAVRALGRYPEPPGDLLERLTADADWTVAVQAFRALSRATRGGPGLRMARALRARVDRALAPERALHGRELHVLLAALASAGPFAVQSSTHGVAKEALERLGRVPGEEPPSRDRGLAHCAAAKLVDLGREWPTQLKTCGLGKVSEARRQQGQAEVLAAASGAEAERAAGLARLFRTEAPRVREAVLRAVPAVDHEDARALVLAGLAGRDPGVATAAAEALREIERRVGRLADPSRDPDPSRHGREHRTRFPVGRLEKALAAAHATLAEADDVEGLQTWLRAVEAAQARAQIPRVRPLARHHNPAVRRRARAALDVLGAEPPAGDPAPPPNPLPPERFPAPDAQMEAHLETDRGPVVLALLPGAAPATVARFVGLAQEGFYDGSSFHRVVPAFVVQGGDPRGDGYGGPGWTQRCEDNRVPYERGTVGIALAGRDTGGSQLFITHTRQPHLDGRYTAFARVRRGMEVVDRIQEGDRIRSVEIRRVSRENGE